MRCRSLPHLVLISPGKPDSLEVVRPRPAHIPNHVMHDRAIRRRRFYKLNPPVLGEAGGQNDVLIFENPVIRD
jgi:hypothetical protein